MRNTAWRARGVVGLAGVAAWLLAACGTAALDGAASRGSALAAIQTPAPPSMQASEPPLASTFGGGGCMCPVGTGDPSCDSPLTNDLPVVQPVGDKIPTYGLGTGPVYWSGQNVWHTAGELAVVLVDPTVRAPVSVTFAGPNAPASATFGGEAQLTIQPVRGGWAYASERFIPSVAGCWAMHATFGATRVVVHFTVVNGSPPPA
jgi:hypothetical protein